jgi:hypothetical protein
VRHSSLSTVASRKLREPAAGHADRRWRRPTSVWARVVNDGGDAVGSPGPYFDSGDPVKWPVGGGIEVLGQLAGGFHRGSRKRGADHPENECLGEGRDHRVDCGEPWPPATTFASLDDVERQEHAFPPLTSSARKTRSRLRAIKSGPPLFPGLYAWSP